MTFKELRKRNNLTVRQASKKLGIKEATIYAYENSYRLPSINILTKMSLVYNASMSTLLLTFNYHKALKNGDPTNEDKVIEAFEGISIDESLIILSNIAEKLKKDM